MKFCLEIGEVEKNLVEFNFDQLLGRLVIKVNRKEVRRHTRLFNEPMAETHTVTVGDGERMIVRFEKERISTFSQKCRVYLNDRLYKYYEGV